MSLTFEKVGLVHHGTTLSLELKPGQSLAVVGPVAAGKSKLLRIAMGLEPPDRGKVAVPGAISTSNGGLNPGDKPQDLGRRRGDNLAAAASEVLVALRLWDVRHTLIGELPPRQVAACEMVESFLGSPSLLVFDENLDRLDPWARVGALGLIRNRLLSGAAAVVATSCLDLVASFDFVAVLREHRLVYAGSLRDLVASKGQRSLVIETERQTGARALVEPLEIGMVKTETGYRLEPSPGQAQVAKLLREGYGDVKYVVEDLRNVEEIILELIS